MKIALLDRKTLSGDLDLSPLSELGDLVVYETTASDEVLDRIVDAEVIVTNKVIIDRDLMKQAKKLKLICVAATGMNNIDLQAAKELGVEVKNVAGYSTKSVAQHTFAMLFALIEQIPYYDRYTKDGGWSKNDIFTDLSRPFFEISGKDWGIIGLGAIGQEVAKNATTFGANVSYYSTSGLNSNQPYPQKSLEELLSSSDIISIHAPLNSNTDNLLNAKNLPLLKDGAILLNLGRGGIINEDDLAMQMDSREIYAALDVTKNEPIEPDNALLHLKNPQRLLITPHIAWASKESRKKLLDGIVDNIKSWR